MKINNLKAILLGLASAVLLISCENDTVKPQTENPPDQTENPPTQPEAPPTSPRTPIQESKIVSSANDFAFRVFAALRKEGQTENLFISPLGISSTLTMALNGANGSTKEAMRQTLGFEQQTDEEINQFFKNMQVLMKGQDEKVTFTSANSIWHDKIWELQPAFLQQNQDYFGATIQGLDFKDPGAKNVINDWAKEKTQGKIENIVQKIPDDAIMYLINAIYFKATWTYPFEKSRTRKIDFRKEDGSTTLVDMMTRSIGKYLYYQDADKEVINLPYGSGQFSMTLIVPSTQNTVSNLNLELSSSQLNNWLTKADTTWRGLSLPKFKMESNKKLNDVLTQLGMGEAFLDGANFSRMLEQDINSKISEVAQKTFVIVNEEGTEAAAVSTSVTTPSSLPPTIYVDRPFIFLIREKSTNAIIFIGQMMNP